MASSPSFHFIDGVVISHTVTKQLMPTAVEKGDSICVVPRSDGRYTLALGLPTHSTYEENKCVEKIGSLSDALSTGKYTSYLCTFLDEKREIVGGKYLDIDNSKTITDLKLATRIVQAFKNKLGTTISQDAFKTCLE